MSEELTQWNYPSAFTSTSQPSTDAGRPAVTTSTQPSSNDASAGGGKSVDEMGTLASFICHVAYLEKRLREDSGTIFVDDKITTTGPRMVLGKGAQFYVERREWKAKAGYHSDQTIQWSKFVAIKRAITTQRSRNFDAQGNWLDILLEIRALMHGYLRYHPNIVRLLGFGWGQLEDSASVYPFLVTEYAEFGSMKSLQLSLPPLPFAVKQKLCHDVARGLSILHACGIIHGDLKHENVLIYKNKYTAPPNQPYTAKLADFGGAAMDLSQKKTHALRMGTFPFEAPEVSTWLSPEALKKTDVYSFGMLVWRVLMDAADLFSELGLHKSTKAQAEESLARLKCNDELICIAVGSIQNYAVMHDLDSQGVDMFLAVLDVTCRADSKLRSLQRAQALLQGHSSSSIDELLNLVLEANSREERNEVNRTPGEHGVSRDSVGFQLGKLGDDYDPQNNVPGYRPHLPHPEVEEFLFEPYRLRNLLGWSQQAQIVRELEVAARGSSQQSTTNLKYFQACYYLFLCYLTGFGVHYDARRACEWLYEASKEDDEADVNYLAGAWLWRFCDALGIEQLTVPSVTLANLEIGAIRGHRNCQKDAQAIIAKIANSDQRVKWKSQMQRADTLFNTMCGGVGMPQFADRKLRRPYNLLDLIALDGLIKEQLGSDYDDCLKIPSDRAVPGVDDAANPKYPFDSIYVNHLGHGLLHYAAALGNLEALKHMITKYKCDINLENRSLNDTPLVNACRGGHYDCAMFLIDSGARPDRSEIGEEAPLHCLSSFQESQMEAMARRLVQAGANIEQPCGITSRRYFSDWEHLLSVSVTPIGRAVITQSLPAVKILLGLGADPLAKVDLKLSKVGQSAAELAAILTLPEILRTILLYLDKTKGEALHIFDEIGLLQAARSNKIVPGDSLSVQSRIVRHGREYNSALIQTLTTLQERRQRLSSWDNLPRPSQSIAQHLCFEIEMGGNKDIVEALLKMGHSSQGSVEWRPIETAVCTNQEDIFRLLVNYGADVHEGRLCPHGRVRSLLQLFASRPKTTRTGVWIAEYLLRAGVPLEPVADGSPSALTLAIENHFFDLADLLLANGASLNHTYQGQDSQPPSTVLGFLVQNPSQRSMQSISYVLELQSRRGMTISHSLANNGETTSLLSLMNALGMSSSAPPQPNFIVEPKTRLSILHVLAGRPSWMTGSDPHACAQVVNKVLSVFGASTHINHVHPLAGTPLCVAALTGNVVVVSALLEREADVTAGIQASLCFNPYQGKLGLRLPAQDRTPIWLALVAFESRLSEVMDARPRLSTPDPRLEDLDFMIHEHLLPASLDSEPNAEASWRDLRAQKSRFMDENAHRAMGEMAEALTFTEADNKPVDLSNLTEERPSGWVEGCTTTYEMSLRILLNAFRQGTFSKALNRSI